MYRMSGSLPTQEGHEHVGYMDYYPTNGTLDLSYFPYYGKLAQVGLDAIKTVWVKPQANLAWVVVSAHQTQYEILM